MDGSRSGICTPDEYLVMERAAIYRSEYLDGKIYAMSGGTPMHAEIALNAGAELRSRSKGTPCHVFSGDLKVAHQASNSFFYPDISVICGSPIFHDQHQDSVINPILIIEVLSDSTEAFDRGQKFFHYRQIESLEDYLLVSQKAPYIDHYTKQQDGRWLLTPPVEGLSDTVQIASLGCTLSMAEIYDKIVLEPEP